jgi:hypothetical protein
MWAYRCGSVRQGSSRPVERRAEICDENQYPRASIDSDVANVGALIRASGSVFQRLWNPAFYRKKASKQPYR